MSRQYDLYLDKHISNVQKGFGWIQNNLPDLIGFEVFDNIEKHDSSKTSSDEYFAYDAYFYGGNKSYQVVKDFNVAWLKHIHRNPHHWQHWVLINDEPGEGTIVLDMPYKYIIEMICDWWAFSWISGNLYEIFDWYDKHKDHIKLSDKTRLKVDGILSKIRQRLDEKGE